MARDVVQPTVPVSVAADRLNVSDKRVYQMLEEGKLLGTKMNRTVLVYTSSLEWQETMRGNRS